MNKVTIKKLRKAIAAGETDPFLYGEAELHYLKRQLRVLEEGRDAYNQARRQAQGFSK
jgi:hypothetical protein